jgi:predicted DNA-binding transcriptional regulator AlpA
MFAREQYLNEKQVAERCGLKIRTLQQWRFSSQGPPFKKLGGACRYAETDLQRWLDTRPGGGERPEASA